MESFFIPYDSYNSDDMTYDTDEKERDIFREEWDKMIRGEEYEAALPEFGRRLARVRALLQKYNQAPAEDTALQEELLRSIIPDMGERCHFNQPFRCDWGCNIHIGRDFFANFNLTILDEAPVSIGDNVFIGPNVSIYTACHPLDAARRRTGREWAESVRIGNDVWIGGGTSILPGVSIGDGAVVGAGAVVSRDVAPYTVVAGNPARKIKDIPR